MHAGKYSHLKPVHKLVICTLALAVVLWVSVSVLFRPHEYVSPSSCDNNLGIIIKCGLLYAEDNDGQWPERLSQLYPEYVKDFRIFNCPGGKGPRVLTAQDIDAKTSYLYFPERAGQASGVVIEERPGNHRGGRNVGMASGSVEWWREEDERASRELRAPVTVQWGKPDACGLQLGVWLDPRRPFLLATIRNQGDQPVRYSDYRLGSWQGVNIKARKAPEATWHTVALREWQRAHGSGAYPDDVHILQPGEGIPPRYRWAAGDATPGNRLSPSFRLDLREFVWPDSWDDEVEIIVSQHLGDDGSKGTWNGTLESASITVDLIQIRNPKRPEALEWSRPDASGLQLGAWVDTRRPVLFVAIRNQGAQPVGYVDSRIGHVSFVAIRAREAPEDPWKTITRKEQAAGMRSTSDLPTDVHVLPPGGEVFSARLPKRQPTTTPPKPGDKVPHATAGVFAIPWCITDCCFRVDLQKFNWPNSWDGEIEVMVSQSSGEVGSNDTWKGTLESVPVKVRLNAKGEPSDPK